MTLTLDHLRRCMTLPDFSAEEAQLLMAPRPRARLQQFADVPARQAGVLALVFPAADGAPHIVLTRRTDHLRGHSGQISFPGGRRDPDDESFVHTALRETCEELGICGDDIAVHGSLTPFYIPPSNYDVYPSVGSLDAAPVFNPNPDEVAEVFTVPLAHLLEPERQDVEYHDYNGIRVRVPFYRLNGHKVWGATAAMLGELAARLRVVLD